MSGEPPFSPALVGGNDGFILPTSERGKPMRLNALFAMIALTTACGIQEDDAFELDLNGNGVPDSIVAMDNDLFVHSRVVDFSGEVYLYGCIDDECHWDDSVRRMEPVMLNDEVYFAWTFVDDYDTPVLVNCARAGSDESDSLDNWCNLHGEEVSSSPYLWTSDNGSRGLCMTPSDFGLVPHTGTECYYLQQ